MNIEQTTSVMKPMPVYICKKIVGAIKYNAIYGMNDDYYLRPDDEVNYSPFRITKNFYLHCINIGRGYYIKDEEGNESVLSIEEFERYYELKV